jgi:PAS domain S-box-containing protein
MGKLFKILQWLGDTGGWSSPSNARLELRSRWARYLAAILLAVVAQIARLPLHPPTVLPFITYAPFMVVSALLGGLGPGLLSTALCTLEAVYFSLEPLNSLAIKDSTNWNGIGAFVLTGVAASLLTWRLNRASTLIVEANRKISAILASISDGFNTFDREWRYTYVNAAAAKLVGKAPEELLGKNLWELWPQAADSPFGVAYRRSVTENVPVQVEAFYPEPLNAWFEVRCYPSPDGLSLFFTDTTERKRSEEAARRLTSIVESSDNAIVSKDLDGIVVTWNRSAERIYGYSAAEMVGRSIAILFPLDHHDEFTEIMQYLRLGEKIDHLETERVRKDGQRIFVSLTVSPLRDGGGNVVGASSIARDITQRKNADATLKLSEERYRSLALAATQLVWATNPQGEMAEDLFSWCEFTGLSPEELLGWGWISAIHPDDRERTAGTWARAVKNRSMYHADCRMRRRDGEYRWMSVRGVPVLEEGGGVREWVGTWADITDRVRAEEEVHKLNSQLEKRVVARTAELQAANQELEAFAYSISHDLRAPLRAIDGFSRILQEEHAPKLAEEAQRCLNIVRKNALQMGELIDHLLAFSRLSRQDLRKDRVDSGALVRRALEDLAQEQEGRQIEIVVGELPPCEADPALLKQVFVNLFSNALKYTRCRDLAKIEVGSMLQPGAQASDAPVYYVRDNGTGFDMRYVDKLFGVFQRLHRAEDYEGTGVGLALVHRIISRHGGRIWAEAALDQGATFYFTLSA